MNKSERLKLLNLILKKKALKEHGRGPVPSRLVRIYNIKDNNLYSRRFG
ncbi:MAG: hypothetical protein KAR07_05000 [Spirochaetes bacterium]|nr:hypothetical protein [Spirochaetota bacterium]MCK5267501.1 hypothetical protein [Spirochaetota bacterium]